MSERRAAIERSLPHLAHLVRTAVDTWDENESREGRSGAPEHLGRYRVVREVARGGMGIVYEAVDDDLERTVALKVLAGTIFDEERDGRHRREAILAAGLQHPHIVTIHEMGSADDDTGRRIEFIAMEFVRGMTLAERLEQGGESLDESLRLLEEAARAVEFAHDRGVVHRDIKPGNILVEDGGRALLSDFGLAREYDVGSDLTATGATWRPS